ncbi:hypothetical protein AcW1_006701 [Taiwanofungus camphoratus]|nr:hypothetical protein AcV5_009288 [Antrodia cinnamomea]KAI0924635.1 hypothetical protein AcW2_005464 [Antrodia cinnamomea]KAI0954002.1 hypothetical protein AcV7_007369 [Antrodia cinnamomea]KAI0954977.1 hypothetical protein AcW1_006701 [Antrodia cinnamomea]
MGSGKDNWKNDWRSGMEGVEGLNPFLEDFLPPLMLQRPAQFGKTAIAKRMATSVRLTKHLAITRASPMSHYMAAKGSTAWEIAVKERKDVVEDDVPLGWRILEKEPSQVSPVDANKGKKSSGRLFSFWGRREPTPSHSRSASAEGKDMLSERSKSPAMGSHSRQASQDSAKAPVRTSIDKGISPIHATSSTLPSPLASSPAVSAPAAPSISPAPLLQLSSYADAPEPQVDPTQVPPATAPSAVSRFLNRFSRRRSALGSGNPRSSLALSSDDLEFLSDIVPSANDDPEDDQDLTMKSLVSLVEPGPLPPILPPPPPAPPRVPSVSPTGAPGNAVQSGHNTMDSFDSFFGSLDVGPSTSEPAIPPSSSGGPSLRPLIASPLKPSRPSTPAATEVPVPSKRDTRPPSPSLLAFPGPANKQPSQPFFLPSPPSSRSQTPVSVTNTSISQLPVPSPHPLPALKSENRPTSMPSRLSRPRIPSPFIIPPPPSSQGRSHSNVPSSASTSSPSSDSANHSPGSPTSGLPLAELYPMAYRAKQPTQSAPGPPSASCRSQTPIPILAAPPPPPSRASSSSRPPSGPLDAFADDDFASFDTFAVPPTKPSLQIPPPLPPPTSRSQTPAILPPPPSSRSHSSASALAPPPLSSLPSNLRQNPIITIPSRRVDLFDDDDFTEFHSSSTSFFRPSPVQSFDSPSFDDSFTSEQSFLTPGKTQGFDVADFSPVLRTPSPPRPLSKTLSAAPPTLSTKHTEQSQPELTGGTSSLLLARRNRAAQQHQHTLSLVERAAARPGRWPAPPSPLPQAIPSPPSVRSSGSAAFVDLMEDDASSRSHSVGLPGSLSSPALLNPVRSTQAPHGLGIGNVPRLPPSSSSSQNSNAFGSGQHPTSSAGDSTWNVFNTGPPTTGPSMASTQGSGKSGGLSAQDLLFFEGL